MQAKIAAQIYGLGIGYLPLNLIRTEIRNKQLIIKKIEKEKPSANLALAWRIHDAGKAVKWFIEKLKDPEIVRSLLEG